MKHVLIVALFATSFGLLLSGCRKAAPVASVPAPAPGTAAPLRSFVDLEAGWRLTVITPMRKEKGEAEWKYGQPNTKTVTSQSGGISNINVTIELDPSTLFGFERSHYSVEATGLRWQESMRNLNGNETQASAPLLGIFGGKARKQKMRLLFLTRGSDLNYNMALLRAKDAKAMEALTQKIRQEPATACVGDCTWVLPGVAVRPEKPVGSGWAPAI